MREKDQSFRHKITYLAKKPAICPVCENKIFKESLLSGGGRLIADDVTELLHREYKPSSKFGKLFPLNYSIMTCPDCFYSTMPADFDQVPEDRREQLGISKEDRINFANKLIGEPVDFTKYRTLKTGAASFALAVLCYDYFPPKKIPVIKQAICSMRAAFSFEELEKEFPNNYFKFVSELYYKKALFFYKLSIELNQSKEQIMEELNSYGPDLDKNYGYDGIIYLIGILTYKYGMKSDPEFRKKDLEEARGYLGKLFGLGKADYSKPKEILEKSKDFHMMISDELKELNENE